MDAAQHFRHTIATTIRSYPFRIGIYIALTLVLYESFYRLIGPLGAQRLGAENGPLEMAQIGLAAVGAVGLLIAAVRTPSGRAPLVACTALIVYAVARESDLILETLLFDDAYKYVVGIPAAAVTIGFIFVERRTFFANTMQLMTHPAATIFAIAGIYLCFVCQNLDRPNLWAAPDGTVVESTKALVEEFMELFAYLLLAISGIEAMIAAKQRLTSVQPISSEQSGADESRRIAA